MGSQSQRGEHHISDMSSIELTDVNRRHIDIRLLPSLVPADFRNETAKIIEPELLARINKLRNLIDAGVVDSESSLPGRSFFLSVCLQTSC